MTETEVVTELPHISILGKAFFYFGNKILANQSRNHWCGGTIMTVTGQMSTYSCNRKEGHAGHCRNGRKEW